jgi:hypothetical protein
MKAKVIADADSLFLELQKLFQWADRVDMAFAWAGSDQERARHWKAMDLAKVGRAVIGTAFAQTEPRALELLSAGSDRLRLVINSEGTFHPKVIVGRKGEFARAIVGSANFTGAAYTSNTEISVLLAGSVRDGNFREIAEFIEEHWNLGVPLTPEWLSEYAKAWEAAKRRKIVVPGAKLEISSISSLDMSWEAYFALINSQHNRPLAAGNKVRVFGDHPSYFNELDEADRIFASHERFADIPKRDRHILMGMGESSGFIGNMSAAGFAKQIVNDHPEKIGIALDKVPVAGEISSNLVEDVLNQLTALKGVSVGVASRLLAAKRPDLFVSVNNGSKPQLARLIGGKRVDTVKQYVGLLQKIWATDWYRSGKPRDGIETSVWERRAALLDSALYEQV